MKKLLTLALALFVNLVINATTYKIVKADFCKDIYSDFIVTYPANSYVTVEHRDIIVTLDSVTVFHFSLEPYEEFDLQFIHCLKVWERMTDTHLQLDFGKWTEMETEEEKGYYISFVLDSIRSYGFYLVKIKE